MKRKLTLPIRYKFLVSNLLVVTAVVSIITLTMANLFHDDKKGYIHDLAVTSATHSAEEAHAILRGYQERLLLFGRFMLDRELAQSKKKTILEGMFSDFPEVIGVTLIDENGKQATLYDSALILEAGLSTDDFTAYRIINPLPLGIIHRDKIYLENTTLSDKLPALTMAIALTKPNGKVVILSGLIKLDSLLHIVKRSNLFNTYIMDSGNTLLAHRNTEFVLKRKKVDWLDDVSELRNQHNLGFTREYSVNDQKMIGGFVPVNIGNLLIVSEIPESAAYLTTRDLLDNLVGISLLLLVVSVLVSLVSALRITRPIEQLSDAAHIVGQGDFNFKVNVRSNDEIGNLAKSFNKMSDELKSRELKLQDAQVALIQSEKMSAFGQLSAGIAHEVKNPLTGILGIAQLAKRKMEADNPLFEKMEVIEKETKRCKTIIDDLMKFARTDNHVREAMDINHVVNDAVKIVNHQLTINRVKIKTDLEEGLSQVMGEANQIQQVVMNLLINAQQALNGAAGEVSIVTQSAGPENIKIIISDNGPGIPEDVITRIFEPFYTTKPAGEGTGLGLSITYGIIKDHKGDIKVANNADKGVSFFIKLPVKGENEK